MPLDDRVFVARRFQRAVRIDTDLDDPSALEGFVCPRSSAVVLETMSRHVAESGQGLSHGLDLTAAANLVWSWPFRPCCTVNPMYGAKRAR